MTCQYCRAQIETDAHRCTRCGRRTVDRTPVQMSAAVPNLETLERPASTAPAPGPQLVPHSPKHAERTSGPGFQANLFGPVSATSVAADTGTSRPSAMRSRTRKNHSQQQSLNFHQRPTVNNSINASVFCESPVAVSAHRILAATIDMAFAVIALGIFVATFQLSGAEFVLTKATAPYYGAAAILISLFYRVLFCIANFDTPGLRWTGLRVVDFDGRPPSRKHRWYRLLGGFVGAIAAGIGLLWAMVDEERLTWHDHISKTFPTPRFL